MAEQILTAAQVTQPGAYWWRRSPGREWYVVNVACLASADRLSLLEPWVIDGPSRLHGEFIGPLATPAVTVADSTAAKLDELLVEVRGLRNDMKAASSPVPRTEQAAREAFYEESLKTGICAGASDLATAETRRFDASEMAKPLNANEKNMITAALCRMIENGASPGSLNSAREGLVKQIELLNLPITFAR